jgi:hypothetical protein
LNNSKSRLSAHGSRQANVQCAVENFLFAGDEGHAGCKIGPKHEPFYEQEALEDQPDIMPLYAAACLDDPYAEPDDYEGEDDLVTVSLETLIELEFSPSRFPILADRMR